MPSRDVRIISAKERRVGADIHTVAGHAAHGVPIRRKASRAHGRRSEGRRQFRGTLGHEGNLLAVGDTLSVLRKGTHIIDHATGGRGDRAGIGA